MRSFLSNSKALIIVVVFLSLCGLSCKQKSSEQADTIKPEPAQTKIETETKTEPETKAEATAAETTTLVEPTIPEESADNIAVTVRDILSPAYLQLKPPTKVRASAKDSVGY